MDFDKKFSKIKITAEELSPYFPKGTKGLAKLAKNISHYMKRAKHAQLVEINKLNNHRKLQNLRKSVNNLIHAVQEADEGLNGHSEALLNDIKNNKVIINILNCIQERPKSINKKILEILFENVHILCEKKFPKISWYTNTTPAKNSPTKSKKLKSFGLLCREIAIKINIVVHMTTINKYLTTASKKRKLNKSTRNNSK